MRWRDRAPLKGAVSTVQTDRLTISGPAYSGDLMDPTFLVDTYASERLKTLSVWAMFEDADLDIRPHPNLAHDRTFREHMVHQCMSEDKWFTGMLGIDVGAPPIPAEETRLAFIRRYAQDSAKRLARLAEKNGSGGGRTLRSSTRCAAAHGSW